MVAVAVDIAIDEIVGEEDEVIDGHRYCGQQNGNSAVALVAPELVEEGGGASRHSDQHLDGLQKGDQLGHGQRDGNLDHFERVIEVHDRVNGVVDGIAPATDGRQLAVDGEAVDQCNDVVRPVQANQFLLAQHQKHSVAQLDQLGPGEQPHPVLDCRVLLD